MKQKNLKTTKNLHQKPKKKKTNNNKKKKKKGKKEENQSHYAVKGKSIKGSFDHQKCAKKQLVKLCFPRIFLSTNHVRIHQQFHHRGNSSA